MQLVIPKELGGPGGEGANPEKLFALGYSACFLGAMRVAAGQTKIKVPDGSTVTATIGIGPRSEGGFGITADLDVYLPGLAEAEAQKLVDGDAHHLPLFQRHPRQRGREDHDAGLRRIGGAVPRDDAVPMGSSGDGLPPDSCPSERART